MQEAKSIPPKWQQQDLHQDAAIQTTKLKIWVSKGIESKTVSYKMETYKFIILFIYFFFSQKLCMIE